MKNYIYSLEEIPKLVESLKKDIQGCNILAFTGELGAGKTTLIRNLLSSLGVDEEEVISPTFNYVNIYKPKLSQFKRIYHFDLYRINSVEEFLEAGFDEYLDDPDALVLIEWPQVIKSLLQKGVCWLNIDYEGSDKRKIFVSK